MRLSISNPRKCNFINLRIVVKLDYKSPANQFCQEKQGRLDVEIANLKLGATINLVVLYLYITKKNLLLRKFYRNAKKTI